MDYEKEMKFYIRKLGLSEEEILEKFWTLTEEEQSKVLFNLAKKCDALDLGLSVNATDEEIDAVRKERTRQHAISLGLPENASIKEINEFFMEQERIKAIKDLGLSENSSWDDILEAEGFSPIPSYEEVVENNKKSSGRR